MPIIKSAKKRVRQMNKAKARNNTVRQALRASLKTFALATKTNKNVTEAQKQVESALDMAAKKGVIHKNKVARKKRQLAVAAKASGNKIEKSATTKKPVAKKTAAKKPAAKK